MMRRVEIGPDPPPPWSRKVFRVNFDVSDRNSSHAVLRALGRPLTIWSGDSRRSGRALGGKGGKADPIGITCGMPQSLCCKCWSVRRSLSCSRKQDTIYIKVLVFDENVVQPTGWRVLVQSGSDKPLESMRLGKKPSLWRKGKV